MDDKKSVRNLWWVTDMLPVWAAVTAHVYTKPLHLAHLRGTSLYVIYISKNFQNVHTGLKICIFHGDRNTKHYTLAIVKNQVFKISIVYLNEYVS